MEKAKVYYSDLRAKPGLNLLQKLQRLVRAAGLDTIEMQDKFVAIKIHFGEPGNLSYLRPNYAKALADVIKAQGGRPFLTDCNTLYPGHRKNALEHLLAAAENGFNYISCGCPIIIGDGLRGTDEVAVPVHNGELVKNAKIGHAVMDADIIISLTHFKGHEATGFGGAIKNLGMGCGSRAGKMEQHSQSKPRVSQSRCRGCQLCQNSCANNGIEYGADGKARINTDNCVGCGRCIGACNFDAIYAVEDSSMVLLDQKMAEYTQAVCYGRPNFHISLVQDVSPVCDCYGSNDAPILPDIGMFASFDPVAIDQACADACLKADPLPNSILSENLSHGCDHPHDHFLATNPNAEWKAALEHGEKIGLGSREYELIQMK